MRRAQKLAKVSSQKRLTRFLPPKEWPACWLSSRLSSTEAVVKERSKQFSESAGRQEFIGKSANPITQGDCVMNWFGQDNPAEPWGGNDGRENW